MSIEKIALLIMNHQRAIFNFEPLAWHQFSKKDKEIPLQLAKKIYKIFDARISELLKYNNEQVELRREAENKIRKYNNSTSTADADDVERVATAIGYTLCELEEDTLAHGLTLEEWRALARAALSAIQSRDAGLREALEKIRDKWIANNSEGDDWEDGFDDGLKVCHDIAHAALTEGGDA